MYVNKPHPRAATSFGKFKFPFTFSRQMRVLIKFIEIHERVSRHGRAWKYLYFEYIIERSIGTHKFNTQPIAYICWYCIHIIHNNNKHPVACCADDDAVLIYDF